VRILDFRSDKDENPLSVKSYNKSEISDLKSQIKNQKLSDGE
jgi:hypothetical protein